MANKYNNDFYSSCMGIGIIEPSGRIIEHTPEFANILGYKINDTLIDKNIFEYWTDTNKLELFLQTLRIEKQIKNSAQTFLDCKNNSLPLIINAYGEFELDGILQKIVFFVVDISSAINMKNTINSEQELLETINTIRKATHDNSNMLAVVKGLSGILYKGKIEEKKIRKIAAEINKAAKTAITINNHIEELVKSIGL